MANSKTYAVDPAILTPQSISGKASLPVDSAAPFWAALFQAANYSTGLEVLDTTASNISLDVYETRLTVSGTMAFTLPNGTVTGQKKRIVCDSAASTPAATLTITTPETASGFACSAVFFFDTAGQAIELYWTGTKWRCTRVQRAGGVADNVVIGTTVLTGKNLWQRYNCSVTGTVSSTGANALPNGSAVGEQCWITNTTAASTPVGSIDGVFTSGLAAPFTHCGAIGVVASATAVGDSCLLTWNGVSWDVAYQSGITFS